MQASGQPSLVLTILYVRDLPRAVAFYDNVFGWQKTVDESVYVEYELSPEVRIGLMPQPHTRNFLGDEFGIKEPLDGSPRAELYLRFESVDAAVARLQQAGSKCVGPLAERAWGDRAAYFMDLDGYVLAVAEPSPASPS